MYENSERMNLFPTGLPGLIFDFPANSRSSSPAELLALWICYDLRCLLWAIAPLLGFPFQLHSYCGVFFTFLNSIQGDWKYSFPCSTCIMSNTFVVIVMLLVLETLKLTVINLKAWNSLFIFFALIPHVIFETW